MNLVKYIKDSFDELRNKVSWISWEEAQKSTVVVALFTVLFALAVFAVDKLFQSGLTEYFKLF
ncbi:preprotein translocase subunit SecE [Lutibacter holmesii]|uniref:Protein translocase subunit SecE n=1 Tax=Lutibacter holmesii TaxID=1137985 RepID=A0ABW3WNA3_9FLAO